VLLISLASTSLLPPAFFTFRFRVARAFAGWETTAYPFAMKLLFLYGPPPPANSPVAREVSALTGYRLFHNHLAVNPGPRRLRLRHPGFIALREQIWFATFRRALADRVPGLVFTFNPENSVPQRFIDKLFAEIAAGGGEVIPVEPTTEAVLEAR